jgi:hypothetical protein
MISNIQEKGSEATFLIICNNNNNNNNSKWGKLRFLIEKNI